jgi:hypothetical protein
MDEQTTPAPETPIITPDPVVADTPVVEPLQTEAAQAPAEPVSAPETPQNVPLSEPLPATPEAPTPHLPVDEALLEITPESAPQGAGAVAEVPEVETPAAPPTPIPDASPAEETPQTPPAQAAPQPEPAPTSQTQQGTPQPEPTPESTRTPLDANSQGRSGDGLVESVPAQAQEIATPPRNILMLLLTKAHLVTQLRKQKKLIKVMGLFATKKSITNDDVEKLLHVSDATALRYLTHLKKENKIVQIGKTGQGVTYTKR